MGIFGYVGADRWGDLSKRDLDARKIDIAHVETTASQTSQVLLLIDPSGERTIIGFVRDELAAVPVEQGVVEPGDLVYFAVWRP